MLEKNEASSSVLRTSPSPFSEQNREGERNFDIGLTLRNSKSAQLKRTASYAHPAYKFLHRLLSVCLVL